MLKIGQNWGKIANYPPQCSTKIGTTDCSCLSTKHFIRFFIIQSFRLRLLVLLYFPFFFFFFFLAESNENFKKQ